MTDEATAAQVRQVALDVARCPEVPLARRQPGHPCHKIVTLQSEDPPNWQVPEGWAGNLTSSKILFLSSNPSISETGQYDNPLHAEDYPRGSWGDDAIADFAIRRFGDGDGYPATIDGRGRRRDGELADVTKFWVHMRSRAAELIPGARPDEHYAMTEVVHCKSRQEIGVAEAVPRCVSTHLDPIVALSPAPLVVVLGAQARNRISRLWQLPDGFGTKDAVGQERRNLAIRTVGGTQRLIAYLQHPAAWVSPKTFANAYPDHLTMLTDLVADRITLQDAARVIQG